MGLKKRVRQKVVQVRQWQEKLKANAEKHFWLLVLLIILDFINIMTVIRIAAFFIRHGLEILYTFLPILIEIIDIIESLASTFSYYKKEFFYGFFYFQVIWCFEQKVFIRVAPS